MALKPTIYKLKIALTDINRDYYDSLNLTIALHPSENLQRMMARVLAFTLNAQPDLTFTKGLSNIEQPDIWHKTLDDQISVWIEVGEPDPERIKKSTRLARNVRIYSFNTKSDVWWKQNADKLNLLGAEIYKFDSEAIEEFAKLAKRTMDFSIMLTGNSAYISTENGDCEVEWQQLKV